MTLNQIVERLIKDDGSVSQYHRAISLFEFQVAIFNPSSFKRLIATAQAERAPTRILRRARIFAAIKIIEKIESNLKQQKGDYVSFRDTAADEGCRSIFEVIATNGGWRGIRYLRSTRNLDNKIAKRRNEAQSAANIVDFSYRFSKNLASARYPGRRNPGGVNAARYVVRKAYEPAMSNTKVKDRWREYQVPAVFMYLLLNQGFNFGPPRIGSKDFVEVLLRQVGDVDALRKYFFAYQIVRSALSKLKYKGFPLLDVVLECSPLPQLNAPEFGQKIKTGFDKWLQGGDQD
jgi:hypothetical protein